MLKIFVAFFLLIFLSPSLIRRDHDVRSYFVVWNVGQGQWSTLVDESSCHHFDMGGERNPLSHVRRSCRGKSNTISLSHWDLDHVGFLPRARTQLSRACIETPPLGTSSARKMKMVASYPRCAGGNLSIRDRTRELTDFSAVNFSKNLNELKKKTNDFSHVFLVRNQILIPGDSTAHQEKAWSHAADLRRVRFLLLGHHGSRTSTSAELLAQLRGLKMAVASARFAKYGHPHQEVVQRLSQLGVPLLKTEDWGNIWFETVESPPQSH